MFIAFAALLGLIIGSFLTVCVYRIPYGREKGPPNWEEEDVAAGKDDKAPEEQPLRKLSIISPARSFCPNCEKQLLWWQNLPVLSWLLLGGKCGFCGERISARYPLIELFSGFLCALSVWRFGVTLEALTVYAFCAALIVISFIDIDYYIIPDVISLPGTALGLCIGVINNFTNWFGFPVVSGILSSLGGVLAGAGFLFLISEAYYRIRGRIGLGMGDVKLLAMVGAFWGAQGSIITMFAGSLIGSVIGILMMVFLRRKLNYQLPFGPYLALGCMIYLFAFQPDTPFQLLPPLF